MVGRARYCGGNGGKWTCLLHCCLRWGYVKEELNDPKYGGRINVLRTLAMLLLFSACATSSAGSVYAGKIGKDFLTLLCDGPNLIDSSCRLATGSPEVQVLRFSNQQTRYSHLLKQGMDGVLENSTRPDRPSDSDISLLRGLQLSECHPAETSNLWPGDILQLCIPSDSSTVVLFVRGVCDRCNFEPIVLKRSGD